MVARTFSLRISTLPFSFAFAFVTFSVLRATLGLRVSASEEIEGLDLGEHGMPAYPDFTDLAKSPVVLDSLPRTAAIAGRAAPAAQLS